MTDDKDLEWRIERLEAAVFSMMPKAEADGWVTNASYGDQETVDFIASENPKFNVTVGTAKATPMRSALALSTDGFVGIYLVPR